MTTTNNFYEEVRAMKRKWIINPGILFLVLALSGVLMSGCGNAKKEAGAESAIIPTQAATVGIDVCTNCHAGQTAQWVGSVHANVNNTPAYGDFTGAICATCHDQLGDGQLLTAEVSTTGTLPRPIVGCESCHGGGAQHFGVGPIALTRVAADATGSGQFNTCTVCHQTASGYHGETNTSAYSTPTATTLRCFQSIPLH